MHTLQADPQWTVVALDYELGYLLEPKSAPLGWTPNGQVLARFWRFSTRASLAMDEAQSWLGQVGNGAAGVAGLQPAIDIETYVAAADRIKQLIYEGDCYQVNFTFPIAFEWFGSPLALYARLRELQPVRYGGFIGDCSQGHVSLSPELFIERRGKCVVTRPMKGTAPHGVSPGQLRDSVKDRAENVMIVDLLRNDLGRVAEQGSVVVDRLFDIEEYPTLWQMVSEVSADVGNRSFGEILSALFPCGSITGAPKIRATQIASGLEFGQRGIYTGALGWLAPDGDFRLNVAIRTLELAAGGRGRMCVGSGIVADSFPDAEWQECLLKSRFLHDCDPGVSLIETLSLEEGQYPRLAAHLERLRRSARWLGFACDETRVAELLAEQPATGIWRVRLTLAKSGCVAVQSFPLQPEPMAQRSAILAATPIKSGYPLRRHKTTDRAIYDEALNCVADDPRLFDVVFLNERGEVAEGARSNVFVERNGILLTPPLTSGALPGVLRAELLADGRAREAVLWPDDLAGRFWLGNALRGLIPVELRPGI